MRELAFATRQAPTDLAQRVGPAQLAEQHRDELPPARKSPRMPLCLRLEHRLLKVHARKELE
jgi:hypothetical protein